MQKLLVQVHVPVIEEKFDIFIPPNKKVKTVIKLISKAISEITEGSFIENPTTFLYNIETGEAYDITKTVKDAGIDNGSQVILY